MRGFWRFAGEMLAVRKSNCRVDFWHGANTVSWLFQRVKREKVNGQSRALSWKFRGKRSLEIIW